MNKNKHKIITFAALMTVATIVIHFINRTIAAAAQLKQLLGITHSKYFEWRFGNIYYTLGEKQIFCIKSVVLEKILV